MENKPGGIKHAHTVTEVAASAGVPGHLTANSREPLVPSTGKQDKR